MPLISEAEISAVRVAFAQLLSELEEQAKTPSTAEQKEVDVKKTAETVAKRVYEELASTVRKKEELNQGLVRLRLNAAKAAFFSPFRIPKDLAAWLRDPKTVDPEDHHWYSLCFEEEQERSEV